MRYNSSVEVFGKYGLTLDLDDQAQLSDWESRLKKLLDARQKELPHAKNPSLRHKVELECAEVHDVVKKTTTIAQAASAASASTTANLPSDENLQTETLSSTTDLTKQGCRTPIKKEHVSAALDIRVKLRSLTGFGGTFSMAKVVGAALAVFLTNSPEPSKSVELPKTAESPKSPELSTSPEPPIFVESLKSEPSKLAEPSKPIESSKSASEPSQTSTQIAQQAQPSSPVPQPERQPEHPVKPKIQLALLRIESTPPDASITIRGTKQPLKTPAEFNLIPGDYDVALALDCYSSVSTTLHLQAGENRVLTRELQSRQPALVVRTIPPGARVYVDGTLRNQLTPVTVTGIEPGDRWVTVELAGYRSQNMAVKARCGETVPADFGMLQRPTATLTITSNPRGAWVWTNGYNSGLATPCSIDLPLGENRVRLTGLQNHQPVEKIVFLQDEQSLNLDVPMPQELAAIPANNPSPRRPYMPDPRPEPIPNILVWCGLDYSMVKMIGTEREFPPDEFFPTGYDRRGRLAEPMTSAWNDLFMREVYPHLSRELGTTVQADLSAVNARNARVGPEKIVQEDSSPIESYDNATNFNPVRVFHHAGRNLPTHISNADIAAAIRSYRLETRRGLGLVFIMDRLVKREETGCYFVVFFDIASRRIVSSERICARSGGARYRNYWYGPIKETVKRLPQMYYDARAQR